MRILLANYRYLVYGGPERYMFRVNDVLTGRGHQVFPFSIKYNQNMPSPFSKYFVHPLGREDEITFREHGLRITTIVRTLNRLFYAKDVERAVLKLAHDTKPEIAYILHYLRKLSPSLLVGLKKAGVPIVVRLSDYGMLCPEFHFLRNEAPCDLCRDGNIRPSVLNHCVQGSYVASFINYLATSFHRYRKYFDLIDVFVTTNEFMYEVMCAAHYPESRLRYIPTFIEDTIFNCRPDASKGDYIIFNGRVEYIKGVHILLDAYAMLRRKRPNLRTRLKILGNGDKSYIVALSDQVRKYGIEEFVQFLGFLDSSDVASNLRGARLSVVPSICYENLPNALLESMACGTPVLASNLGSLSNAVEDGKTGLLFEPLDCNDLADKLEFCLDRQELLCEMSSQAAKISKIKYSQAKHAESLEKLFSELSSR